MTHLSHEELQRWRDAPAPGERDRIVAHFAECQECCEQYAELMRTRPPEVPPSLDAAAFAVRGYGVSGSAQERGWRYAWFSTLPLPAVAAVASIVLVAAGVLWTRQPRPDEPILRGSGTPAGVELVSPVDGATVGDTLQFEWRAGNVSACRLQVFDPARPDAAIIDRGAESTGQITPDERQRLVAGVTYRWFVECESSGVIISSPSSRFNIR